MTTENKETATCAICKGDFPAERAELGYNYCMNKACAAEGFKGKPIEVIFTEADTARF